MTSEKELEMKLNKRKTTVNTYAVNPKHLDYSLNIINEKLNNSSSYSLNENNSKFECIYIRPTNGRADDQLRRNHSIQYFSFPDYKFQTLIVNDLKHGADASGAIGFFVDVGTEGYFSDLKVTTQQYR